VDIDLSQLREMHTRLPTELALLMVGQTAMALERNGHTPGVRVSLDLEQILSNGSLSWPRVDMSKVNQHDHHRITELGAETVALAWPIGIGHGALFAGCSAVDAQTGFLRTREEEQLHWK
jgi:hypothetical protein